MKNNSKKNWRAILTFILIVSFAGCGEMLDNPTIDKETGEDITFLIVDFNFFTTRVSYKFIDAKDNSLITKPVKMWFTGTNANDIVNFAGEKNEDYITSIGQMELTVDPNLDINESNPMQFAVNIEIDGYLPFSQGIKLNSEGKKTFELLLTKESEGEEITLEGEENGGSYIFSFANNTGKSVKLNEYEIEYSVDTIDIKKFKNVDGNIFDPINDISLTLEKFYDFPYVVADMNIKGTSKPAGFQRLEMGTLIKIIINGQRVADLNGGTVNLVAKVTDATDILGFAEPANTQASNNGKWNYLGLLDNLDALGDQYDFIRASKEEVSALGYQLTIESSNIISSFSIDADIIGSQGDTIKTVNFKGNFPETFILENVPAQSATIKFRNNNPSFQAIDSLRVANLSTGGDDITVYGVNGYEPYQVVLKALCKDNTSIAVAPTYSAEIRIVDSGDYWQGIDMIGGVVDIFAKPDQKYELRLLWKDKYEDTDFGTTFDADGNYVNKTDATITTGETADGRKQIRIVHTFDQSICDDMNW